MRIRQYGRGRYLPERQQVMGYVQIVSELRWRPVIGWFWQAVADVPTTDLTANWVYWRVNDMVDECADFWKGRLQP